MESPDTAPVLLPEAPGAKAARHCGIWALVLVVIFFPASLVLAIIAIIQNVRARIRARKAPQSYRVPSRAGMIMGVTSLLAVPVFVFFVGILIFVVKSKKAWERDQVAINNLSSGLAELSKGYGAGVVQGRTEGETLQALEARLRESGEKLGNPWDPKAPAFEYSVAVLKGLDESGIREAARSRAAALGRSVFVVQFPSQGGGLIAGAVQTKVPVEETRVTVQTLPLD